MAGEDSSEVPGVVLLIHYSEVLLDSLSKLSIIVGIEVVGVDNGRGDVILEVVVLPEDAFDLADDLMNVVRSFKCNDQ